MQFEFVTNLTFCISFEGSDPSKLNAICDRIFGVHNLSTTTCAYANYGALLTDEICPRVRWIMRNVNSGSLQYINAFIQIWGPTDMAGCWYLPENRSTEYNVLRFKITSRLVLRQHDVVCWRKTFGWSRVPTPDSDLSMSYSSSPVPYLVL